MSGLENQLLELIAAGGDIGIVAVVFFIWKIDRRLVVLEQRFQALYGKVKNIEKEKIT